MFNASIPGMTTHELNTQTARARRLDLILNNANVSACRAKNEKNVSNSQGLMAEGH